MRLHTPLLALAVTLTLGTLAQAQTPDPYVPLFRHLLGFARDTTPNGTFDGAFEDIDADDRPTPGNYHRGTTLVRDGATITYSANTTYGGFFAAKNDTSLNITNIQNQGYYTIAGQGSHTQVQFFAPITPAEATFNWKVTGTSSTPYGTATSRLDFLAGSYPGSGINDLYSAPGHLQEYGPGSYSYNLPTGLTGIIDLFYWSSAYIEVLDTQTAGHVGESFSAFANFSSTYILESIELRDSNGDRIPTWTMTEVSSGLVMFDQDGRTLAAGATAPEPGALLFLALGGMLTPMLRRRNEPRDAKA